MSRALVLGSGGITGIAWELGVLSGGKPGRFDAVIGTSAGSFVGAIVADPEAMRRACEAASRADRTTARRELTAGLSNSIPRLLAVRGAAGDLLLRGWTIGAIVRRMSTIARRDPHAIKGAKAAASKLSAGAPLTAADLRGLAPLSVGQRQSAVAAYESYWARRLGVVEWPQDLAIVAMGGATGVRRVFDSSDGVPVARAVAASCAIPGLLGAVGIGTDSYFDAGPADSTNADLAAGHDEITILAPSSRPPLDDHVATLRAAGAAVTVVTPRDPAVLGDGQHRLDVAREPASFELGMTDARLLSA